jgi:hypothetical protein
VQMQVVGGAHQDGMLFFCSADGGEAKEERLSLPRLGKMLGL